MADLAMINSCEVVPQWYRTVMAMNLRLSDDETVALRRRAEADGESMQDVVKRALHEYLDRRPDRLANAIKRVVSEDAELLERLSQ